ncbi:MAG: twin-arginine translocase subunit TatC [Rhodopirellula sp.]|nr:twin-arginine translocase subunit TatC [Rhodopirellula sp.]
MPRREYNEDLFKNSTMTFGEHLEELRTCLFNSLTGLVIGFLVGLFLGRAVVGMIQAPLVSAMTDYYETESAKKVAEIAAGIEARGGSGAADLQETAEFIERENLLLDQAYISPHYLLEQLKAAYPDELAAVKVPKADNSAEMTRDKMIRLLMWRPAEDDQRTKVTSLNAQEPFAIYVKAALLVGVVIASPWIFYQIWSFVAAGLYPHEKYYVHVFLPFSLGLFLLGASLAFFFVFEPVLDFLLGFNAWLKIDPEPRITEWLSFVLILPIGFGIAFQLPLVMLFLERIGIFDVEAYLSKWRIAILVIFTLSMFLTPADPYSMLLMAVPLTVLYFGGVLLCQLMPKRQSPYDNKD